MDKCYLQASFKGHLIKIGTLRLLILGLQYHDFGTILLPPRQVAPLKLQVLQIILKYGLIKLYVPSGQTEHLK